MRKTIKAILPHKDYRLFCLYLSFFAFKYAFYVFNKRWAHSLKTFLLFFKNTVYGY
jgi:predicted membrane protein